MGVIFYLNQSVSLCGGLRGSECSLLWLVAVGDVEVYRGSREAPKSAKDWTVLVLLLLADVQLEVRRLLISVQFNSRRLASPEPYIYVARPVSAVISCLN